MLEEAQKLVKELDKVAELQWLEQKTGVKKQYLVGGAVGVVFLMVAFGFGDSLITNLVALLYPAYMTLKTIETPASQDPIQWYTYWMICGVLSVLECFEDRLVHVIPIYYSLKLAFLLWLFLPQCKGATILYHRVIRPLIQQGGKIRSDKRLSGTIESFASSLTDTVQEGAALVKEAGRAGGDDLKKAATTYIQKLKDN